MAFPPDSSDMGSAPTAPGRQQMGHAAPNPQSVAPGGRSVYGGKPMVAVPKPFVVEGDDNSVTTQGVSGSFDTEDAEGVGGIPVSPEGGTPSPMSGV